MACSGAEKLGIISKAFYALLFEMRCVCVCASCDEKLKRKHTFCYSVDEEKEQKNRRYAPVVGPQIFVRGSRRTVVFRANFLINQIGPMRFECVPCFTGYMGLGVAIQLRNRKSVISIFSVKGRVSF